MFRVFNSFLSPRENDSPRYKLNYKWEPDFESELNVAVSSFYNDDAFHRVFGNGRKIKPEELTWHFIGFILNQRQDPIRQAITVRRNKQLKALITGTLVYGESNVSGLVDLIEKGKIKARSKSATTLKQLSEQHHKVAKEHGAIKNEALEGRLSQYFLAVDNKDEAPSTALFRFQINMVAVEPSEQAKGHMHAMFEAVQQLFGEIPKVQSIDVSTYDKVKVEMYQHLGFTITEEIKYADMEAWRLSFPLS